MKLREDSKGGRQEDVRRVRLARRDRALASRFWYWSEVRRRRHDDVLGVLGDCEFFLDVQTVSRILVRESGYISELSRSEGASALRRLKRAYPQWSWKEGG